MTYQFDDAWPSLHIDGSGEDDGSPGYEWLSPDGAAHWQPDETRPCATWLITRASGSDTAADEPRRQK